MEPESSLPYSQAPATSQHHSTQQTKYLVYSVALCSVFMALTTLLINESNKCPFCLAPIFISGGTNQILGYGLRPARERHFDSFRKFWFSFLRVVHQIWCTLLFTLWHHKYDAWHRHCHLLVIFASDWVAGMSCSWLSMCRNISRPAERNTITVWCKVLEEQT